MIAATSSRTVNVHEDVQAPAVTKPDPMAFFERKFKDLAESVGGIEQRLLAQQTELMGQATERAMGSMTERDAARQEAKRADQRNLNNNGRVYTARAVERDEETLACEIDALARFAGQKGRTAPESIVRQMKATKAGDGSSFYSERQITHLERSFRADSMEDGGALIPEQVNAEIVEYMRANLVSYRRGRNLVLAKGGMRFPKQNTRPLVYWIGEQIAPLATKAGFGSQNMTLKKLGALSVMSNEALSQISGLRQWFLGELQKSSALERQRAFYFGEGAEFRPLGIYQQTDPSMRVARTKAGANATYQEIVTDLVRMQTRLLRDNGDGSGNFSLSNCAWLLNSMVRGGLLTILDGSGQYRFLSEMISAGSLFGVPFDVTDTVPRTGLGAELVGGTASFMGLIDYSNVTVADSGRNSITTADQATVTDSLGASINLFTQDSTALLLTTDQDQLLHYDKAASWLHSIDWMTL
jgi:HK97 family phage major capsid protein